MKVYSEKDFVDVVDEAGNDLPAVPKPWLGTDLVPAGVKAKRASKSKSSGSSDSGTTAKPEGEPAGNASADEWVTYAKASGATDEDLVDEQGEPLGRDALREKFGTKSS